MGVIIDNVHDHRPGINALAAGTPLLVEQVFD